METQQNFDGTPQMPMTGGPNKTGLIVGIVLLVGIILGAGGYFVFGLADRGEKVVEQTISPTSSPESDLKTYTNTEYGFEFQYPSDWKILTLPNDTSEGYLVRIVPADVYTIATNPKYKDGADGIFTTAFWVSTSKITPNQGINTTFAGKSAKDTGWFIQEFLELNTRNIGIFGNPVIDINMHTIDVSTKTIFDQILSTFKFTN